MPSAASLLPSACDSVSQLPKVFSGTKVIEFSSERHSLFEVSEQVSLFGRALDQQKDCIALMNGDEVSAEVMPHANLANGRAIVTLNSSHNGKVRINYIVVLG